MPKIDYNTLLKDQRLDIAVCVGYEFAGDDPRIHSSNNQLIGITALLKRHQFIMFPGQEYDTYTCRKWLIDFNGKPYLYIDFYVYVVTSKKKNPAKTFGSFLASKEVVIYSGHARVGTGPDFDNEHSSKENFIIGLNTTAHAKKELTLQRSPHDKSLREKYVKGLSDRKDNDLESITKKNLFREDLYQVWFFNSCSSIDYLDEIRGKWSIKDKAYKSGLVRTETGKIKSKKNLVYMGSKDLTYANAPLLLEAVITGKSMDAIIKAMDKFETSITGKDESVYFSD